MVYKDFFVYTREYWDFCRGFEIVQSVVDVAGNRMRGFNFNRYGRNSEGDPRPDPREHITVRLDVEDTGILQEVEARLDDMKTRGEIDDWCREEDNPYDITPMSRYDCTYHTAHETSAACALRLYRELENNPSEFRNFKENEHQFLLVFLPLWLKYSGFTLLNDFVVERPAFMDGLARNCAETFEATVDKKRITDKHTFAERLVHLFLNCICIDGVQEIQIISSIVRDLGLKTPREFLDELGQSLVSC